MAEASYGWLRPWVPIGAWEEAKLYSIMDIKRHRKDNQVELSMKPFTKFHKYETTT